MRRPLHLLLSDDTVACLGVRLEQVAVAPAAGPLVITIYLQLTTCEACLRQVSAPRGRASA